MEIASLVDFSSHLRSERSLKMEVIMSASISHARKTAETAFEKTQSQFLDRTRAMRERDTEISDHAEKTRRLRVARLAREKAGKQLS